MLIVIAMIYLNNNNNNNNDNTMFVFVAAPRMPFFAATAPCMPRATRPASLR